MKLTEQTWIDVQDLNTDICHLPVRSVGQHDPLGTNVLEVDAIAAAAVERAESWRQPPVYVGIALYYRCYDGTLNVPPDFSQEFVYYILKYTEAWGIDYVLTVNGYGGNQDSLKQICRRLTNKKTLEAQYWEWMKAIEVDAKHDGAVETGVLDYLVPEFRDTPRAGDLDYLGEWIHGTRVAKYTDEFTENSIVGDSADVQLQGEILSPVNLFDSCVSHIRCPIAEDDCWAEEPTFWMVAGSRSNHFANSVSDQLPSERADTESPDGESPDVPNSS